MGNAKSKKDKYNSTKLTRSDLDFLLSNTKFNADTITEWHRGFHRDCPDGKLSRVKFVEVHKVFFPSGSGDASAFSEHVFRTFDQDNNGHIDFKEFLWAINLISAGTVEQKLKWAFRMYDIDGNGHVDLPEMTKIIKAIREILGKNTPDAALQPEQDITTEEDRVAGNIFQSMDTNRDGILNENEFILGCLNQTSLLEALTFTGKGLAGGPAPP